MTEPQLHPAGRHTWLDPEALSRLGGLKVRARRVVEGVLAGLHRSPHKGSSVEFAEYKEYAPGDPIKHIDWRAFGRSDKYYLKQYEDETNLRAYLLLDVSGSMDFTGSDARLSKLDYAKTLVASLAHLLLGQGDAPGILTFSDKPEVWVGPSSKSTQLEDLLRVLEDARAVDSKTHIATALETIAERVTRRSLVVVVSDMLDTDEELAHMLAVLQSRRLDVALFHIVDPAELSLPYEGLTLFEGLEADGKLLVDPDDIRDAYQSMMEEHLENVMRTCRKARVEYHRTVTVDPFESVLLAMVHRRMKAHRGRGRAP